MPTFLSSIELNIPGEAISPTIRNIHTATAVPIDSRGEAQPPSRDWFDILIAICSIFALSISIYNFLKDIHRQKVILLGKLSRNYALNRRGKCIHANWVLETINRSEFDLKINYVEFFDAFDTNSCQSMRIATINFDLNDTKTRNAVDLILPKADRINFYSQHGDMSKPNPPTAPHTAHIILQDGRLFEAKLSVHEKFIRFKQKRGIHSFFCDPDSVPAQW